MEGKKTNLGNSLFDLLGLAGLSVWLVADIAELGLVICDSLFELRDVVFGVFVSSVKHVSYADECVTLALEVFEDAFLPSSCFVF